jgi:hypothetical protein
MIAFIRKAPFSSSTWPRKVQHRGQHSFEMGQVTTRGLFLLDSNFNDLDPPVRFAITGGTDVYKQAQGQVTEGLQAADDRLLEIEV